MPTPTLLTLDGTSAIRVEPGSTRTITAAVLASEGPQRHTRAQAERAVRRYELPLSSMDAGELAAVAAALNDSRYGLEPVEWRHPVDDPSPPADPVLYRIVIEGGVQIARTRGGVSAGGTLILEEW